MNPTVPQPSAAVPYSCGEIAGECEPAFRDLNLAQLPWALALDEAQVLPSRNRVVCVKAHSLRQTLCLEWPGPDGRPASVFAKRYLPRNVLRGWLCALVPSRAEREWRIGREVLRRGIPTALPVLWARRPAKGALRESWVATLGGASRASFKSLWEETPSPQERGRLLRLLAAFIRRSHDLGLVHVDMRAKHILASARPDSDGGGCDFQFIDLDRCRLSRGPAGTYARMSSLYWLFRSLGMEKGPSELRELFLAAYRGTETVSGTERAIAWLAFKVKALRTAGKRRERQRRKRLATGGQTSA